MRAILALGLLITLYASADAATVHHRRHAVVSPNEIYTPAVRSGFAYAPAGPVAPQMRFDDQPSVYDNRYPNWGG